MYARLLFMAITLYTVVSSKSVPSTAALDEEELRKAQEISNNRIILQDSGDIMKWNCSGEANSGSDCTSDQPPLPDAAASDIASVVARDTIASAGVEDRPDKTTPLEHDKKVDEETPEKATILSEVTEAPEVKGKTTLNSYAMVYRAVLQSQHLIPADNETTGVFQWDIFDKVNEDHLVQPSQQGARKSRATSDENPKGFQREGVIEGRNNCTCPTPPGSSLAGNTQQNVSSGSFPIDIILGEDNGITVLDVSRPENSTVLTFPHLKAYSTDFHYNKKLIFHAGNRQIRSTAKLLVSEGVDGAVSLAVDWVHDRLYWISVKHQKLEVVNLDGSNRTLLFDSHTQFTYPNNIVVDPYQKYVFFVSNQTIFRSDLEGKDLVRINHKLKGRGVKYVVLDTHQKRLYFTGRLNMTSGNPYVASSDYNGQGVKDHRLDKVIWNDIYSLGIWKDTLYIAHYTTQNNDTILRLDLAQPAAAPKKLYKSPPSRGVSEQSLTSCGTHCNKFYI